jgi:hypothetical protein
MHIITGFIQTREIFMNKKSILKTQSDSIENTYFTADYTWFYEEGWDENGLR